MKYDNMHVPGCYHRHHCTVVCTCLNVTTVSHHCTVVCTCLNVTTVSHHCTVVCTLECDDYYYYYYRCVCVR